MALNVDGIERKRKKWNRLAKAWYLVSEWLATFCPTAVVTDARPSRTTTAKSYGKETVFIPYGAETGKTDRPRRSPSWASSRASYFLYVSRMEPENHALEVRRSVRKRGDRR